MSAPRATYRLQLRPDGLDFARAAELVPYLADLGVSHVYCSPILEARDGSTHGYDVVDPTRVRAALGGEEGLRALAAAARQHGMGLVVDIVPNHLGVGSENPWWEALLAGGRLSGAAQVFDVAWDHPVPQTAGKVVLPILGRPYGEALHAGELGVEERADGLRLRYHDHDLPLAPETASLVAAAGGPEKLAGEPGREETWEALHELVEAQHYRLVHWRAAGQLVNYRRFFAVNELAAIRVEDPEVFERSHEAILRLVADGVIDGLRIDHPDGLRDPRRYLERLAEGTGAVWTVVEKITEPGEELPDWPVAGTTGYEFARDALGLFVDPEAKGLLGDLERAFDGSTESFEAGTCRAKREVLESDLAADADRLARLLWRAAESRRGVRDVGLADCAEAVRRTAQALEVYRTYVDPETGEASGDDTDRIDRAVSAAAGALPEGSVARAPHRLYRFLGDVLAGRLAPPEPGANGDIEAERELRARFPQLSSAAMAKGLEDTQLYRHRRLLAVNEVGGDPTDWGRTVDEFHGAQLERQRRHPRAMLTTSTHDTKRGEDVRLRLAALSERAALTTATARRWHGQNAWLVRRTPDGLAPDPATELLLYQTLVAVWPIDGSEPDEQLRARVVDYAVKACREARERTNWHDPDEEYEAGVADFVAGLLTRARSGPFLDSLADLAAEAAEIAMVSGLAQTLLRVTSPGVPDTYQGTELWGDNLVDPDNRRPVDFERRQALLAEIAAADPGELFASRRDGRVKLWLLHRALAARRRHTEAFGVQAGYVPVLASGRLASHVVAFARTSPTGRGPLVVVPRLPGRVMAQAGGPPVGPAWEGTEIAVPDDLAGGWHDALTGRAFGAGPLAVGDVLATLPVALLEPR